MDFLYSITSLKLFHLLCLKEFKSLLPCKNNFCRVCAMKRSHDCNSRGSVENALLMKAISNSILPGTLCDQLKQFHFTQIPSFLGQCIMEVAVAGYAFLCTYRAIPHYTTGCAATAIISEEISVPSYQGHLIILQQL